MKITELPPLKVYLFTLIEVSFCCRVSCHTESFSVEGASIEHDLVPVVTSDVNVYGM